MDNNEKVVFTTSALRAMFRTLVYQGISPMEVNVSAMGMARRSMEDIIGKDEAIKLDKQLRTDIGWEK